MSNAVALKQPLEEMGCFKELKKLLLGSPGFIRVTGCLTSQKVNFASGLVSEGLSTLTVCENELRARETYDDWLLYDSDVLLFPPRDIVFYKSAVPGNPIIRARLKVIRALCERKKINVVTCTGGCMDFLLPLSALKNKIISVSPGSEIDPEMLISRLSDAGYERCHRVEMPGQFAVRGGIIDVYDLTCDYPFRIEFWGDTVDSIRSFDSESQRSVENSQKADIYPASEDFGYQTDNSEKNIGSSFIDYFPADTLFFLDEPSRITQNAEVLFKEYTQAVAERQINSGESFPDSGKMMNPAAFYKKFSDKNTVVFSLMDSSGEIKLKYKDSVNVAAKSVSPYNNRFTLLVKDLKKYKKSKYKVIILSASRTRGMRLSKDLMEEGLNAFFCEDGSRILNPAEIMILYGRAKCGFEYPTEKFVLITESDIFGKNLKKKKPFRRYEGRNLSGFSELSVGDYVVHEFYGLGIYQGTEKIEYDGVFKDYLKIEYAKKDILYIQASHIGSLQKYGGIKTDRVLRLNSLTGSEWKKTKSRVKSSVKDIAQELVKLYSVRQNSKGYEFGPDTVWQKEMEEMFPYEETADQITAVEEIKKDMEKPVIMDRILCGDVGYGKTEVAIRAAFKAVSYSKQVIVLVPTTILAQQHYYTFCKRMKDFPVRVDLLCRFRTSSEQKKTLADLKKGLVDIVIGTHRVLSDDVCCRDLGLLIIDEEQRFGVVHKEKIKQIKSQVDVLTLSATPIPRTLHMGLMGIRDMSVLEEPPMDRIPIQTYVTEYDQEIAREAICREIARDGQVYYVFNSISGIPEMASRISRLVPEAVVAYAHGRMKERDLEQIMYRFINREIDVLVSTTIIETGMDISNVNTIIVHDADKFGLAQLYQLRGRIGRSDRPAYAFLMYRPNKILNEEAEKRLHAMREFTDLGSGIKLAMRDLEIRGAGNLLGGRQSGHIDDIGYDLYCKLLSEAVNEARGTGHVPDFETVVDVKINAFIPVEYIGSEGTRLEIYKRIGAIESEEDKREMLDELIDRFQSPPRSVQNLLNVAMLKARAHRLFITEVKQLDSEIKLVFSEKAEIKTEGIPKLISKYGGSLKIYMKERTYFIYGVDENLKKKSVIEILSGLFDSFESELL